METNKQTGTQNILDLEFRKILCVIKPYIPCITNKSYIYYYRMWLERLSRMGPAEKQDRNVYLQELSKQIQAGALEDPFNVLPPDEPLPSYEQFRWQCKVRKVTYISGQG